MNPDDSKRYRALAILRRCGLMPETEAKRRGVPAEVLEAVVTAGLAERRENVVEITERGREARKARNREISEQIKRNVERARRRRAQI